jgi:hypothetical protein
VSPFILFRLFGMLAHNCLILNKSLTVDPCQSGEMILWRCSTFSLFRSNPRFGQSSLGQPHTGYISVFVSERSFERLFTYGV